MVRFVVYSIDWDSDSAMSAELSRVALALGEADQYFVQLVSAQLNEDRGLVVVFEVIDPGDDDDTEDTAPGGQVN